MEAELTGQRHASEQKLAYTYVESPVGRLLLAGDEQGLWIVSFAARRDPVPAGGPLA